MLEYVTNCSETAQKRQNFSASGGGPPAAPAAGQKPYLLKNTSKVGSFWEPDPSLRHDTALFALIMAVPVTPRLSLYFSAAILIQSLHAS